MIDLNIPILPASIAAIVVLHPSRETYFDDVLSVVQSDSALVARAFEMCSVAARAGHSVPNSVTQAMMRVGATRFVSGVVDDYMSDLMSADDELEDEQLRPIRRHSVLVGCANFHVAAKYFREDAQWAHTVGLFHNIGSLVLCRHDAEGYREILDGQWIDSVPVVQGEAEKFGSDHCEIGLRIAKEWKLPDDVKETIRFHHADDLPGDLDAPFTVAINRIGMTFARLIVALESKDDELRDTCRLRIAELLSEKNRSPNPDDLAAIELAIIEDLRPRLAQVGLPLAIDN